MKSFFTQQFSLYVVLATSLMHLFCCGLPLILSIGSLAAMVGMSSGEWAHPEWLEAYEDILMIISGSLLIITGLVQFISNRINCRTDGLCAHKPCDSKKSYARHIYATAVALFSINLAIMLLTH